MKARSLKALYVKPTQITKESPGMRKNSKNFKESFRDEVYF